MCDICETVFVTAFWLNSIVLSVDNVGRTGIDKCSINDRIVPMAQSQLHGVCVQYRCVEDAPEAEVQAVERPSACRYVITIRTHLLCSHPFFASPLAALHARRYELRCERDASAPEHQHQHSGPHSQPLRGMFLVPYFYVAHSLLNLHTVF